MNDGRDNINVKTKGVWGGR